MAIFCIGDIHGKFDELTDIIRTLPRKSNLICVGDIGVGFTDSATPRCLHKVNGVAALRDVYLWMIRGNHDNPFLFREGQAEWNNTLSNIKLLADVDSLDLEGNHIIFVGGAISVDRSHEGRIDGHSWWKEEPVHESCPSRVYQTVQEFGPADLIVTHAGAITTLPVLDAYDPNIYHYSQTDPTLLQDINKERLLLSDCIQYSRAPVAVYGHYHVPLEYINTGVSYRCVAELEVWEFVNEQNAQHQPEATISEEEKAKVDTMPIRVKAPLKGISTTTIQTELIAKANTEDVTTKELINKTEELRNTARVSIRPPMTPYLSALSKINDEEDESANNTLTGSTELSNASPINEQDQVKEDQAQEDQVDSEPQEEVKTLPKIDNTSIPSATGTPNSPDITSETIIINTESHEQKVNDEVNADTQIDSNNKDTSTPVESIHTEESEEKMEVGESIEAVPPSPVTKSVSQTESAQTQQKEQASDKLDPAVLVSSSVSTSIEENNPTILNSTTVENTATSNLLKVTKVDNPNSIKISRTGDENSNKEDNIATIKPTFLHIDSEVAPTLVKKNENPASEPHFEKDSSDSTLEKTDNSNPMETEKAKPVEKKSKQQKKRRFFFFKSKD